MQIPSTQLLLPPSATNLREPLLQNLKPGQILQGTALSGNVDGKLTLQIGVTRLIAETLLSVRPGQSLTLQVVRNETLPELRVLTLPSMAALKAAALKTLLPRQQPLPQVFKALETVIRAAPQEKIPPAIKAQAETLLSQAPAATQPGLGSRIQGALASSGLLTESKLLQQLPTAPADIKLNLSRLYETVSRQLPERLLPLLIPGSPPLPRAEHPAGSEMSDNGIKLLIGLLKSLDGAIARIQTHQLSSLPQDDPNRQVWQFELPMRGDQGFDLFHFRITRDGPRQSAEESPAWSLTLHMNLPTLGPMRVRLRLQGESISTVIHSENSRTDELVRKHLDQLKQGYERSGLEVQRLEAFIGAIDDNHELPIDVSLLNEKA